MNRKQKIMKYREFQKRAVQAGCSKSEFSMYIVLDAKALYAQAKEGKLKLGWSDACLIAAESFAVQQEFIAYLEDDASKTLSFKEKQYNDHVERIFS